MFQVVNIFFSSKYFLDLPDEGPVISGTLPLYSPGEELTANCSSANSFPAASLNWYINGQVGTRNRDVNEPSWMSQYFKDHS